MDTLSILMEADIKKWIRQTLIEYFESHPILLVSADSSGDHPFLNGKMAAGIFGISLVTLHDWMNRGLPPHKQGGRVYFAQSEIVQYVKEDQAEPSPRKSLSSIINALHNSRLKTSVRVVVD